MNTTLAEAYALARGVLHHAESYEHIMTVLCPPAVWLVPLAHDVVPKASLPHLKLGAQNMHPDESGAMTGEISPTMLQDLCEYVIIGHSDRTHQFKESVDFVAEKVESALQHNLIPILCLGEDEENPNTADQLVQTLNHLIKGLDRQQLEKLVVAYEPVWAISTSGSGKQATPEYVGRVLSALRTHLSAKTRILFGGSTNDQNCTSFLELPDCDGLLVGGASLKLPSFLAICHQADDLAHATGHRSLHSSNSNPDAQP